jgi:hypothetical protein
LLKVGGEAHEVLGCHITVAIFNSLGEEPSDMAKIINQVMVNHRKRQLFKDVKNDGGAECFLSQSAETISSAFLCNSG